MTECSCDKRSSAGWSLRGSRSKWVTCGGSGGGGSSGAALITQLTPRLTRASSRTAGAAHSSKLGVTRDTLNLLEKDVLVRPRADYILLKALNIIILLIEWCLLVNHIYKQFDRLGEVFAS